MAFGAMRGNKYIELLSTSNKTLMELWKIHSSIKKEYDAQLKTYVYNVNGKSPIAQMCLPKDNKQRLNLYYPLLVLQLCFPIKVNMLCDIGITSCNNQRKRITLSSNQKAKQTTLLFTVLPFTVKNSNGWMNVLVDIEEIVSDMWNNLTLKGIDFLSLSGVFKLKRIFLMSRDFIHFRDGVFVVNYDQLPKEMSLPKHILQNHVYISSSSHFSLDEFSRGKKSDVLDANSSRNSSRATLDAENFSSSEAKTVAKPEKGLVPDFLNRENNYETYRNFDFNLSMLMFSEKFTENQEECNSGEMSTEPPEELCINNLNEA